MTDFFIASCISEDSGPHGACRKRNNSCIAPRPCAHAQFSAAIPKNSK